MSLPNAKWVAAGPQVILKSDLIDIENAILQQPQVRMQPSLVWVDAGTVRVEATADCMAETAMTGLPNIMNPVCQVDGGLCDGVSRGITSNVSLIMGAGGIWGSEKASQWYAAYAIADDVDTDYTLKGMPVMRVKSQAGQVISLGTLTTPATGIGYGFTTDEMVDGMVYFFSGNSKGLIRTISANNNDSGTGGTITYSGAALTVAAGDWFIVLPPGTNYRLIGTFLNDGSSNIVEFHKSGHVVQWYRDYSVDNIDGVYENILFCCPLATRLTVSVYHHTDTETYFGPDYMAAVTGGNPKCLVCAQDNSTVTFNMAFCKMRVDGDSTVRPIGYEYPAGTGF